MSSSSYSGQTNKSPYKTNAKSPISYDFHIYNFLMSPITYLQSTQERFLLCIPEIIPVKFILFSTQEYKELENGFPSEQRYHNSKKKCGFTQLNRGDLRLRSFSVACFFSKGRQVEVEVVFCCMRLLKRVSGALQERTTALLRKIRKSRQE